MLSKMDILETVDDALGVCLGMITTMYYASGWFDAEPSEYAEVYDPHSYLKMPWNATINLAYLLLSGWWLRWLAYKGELDLQRSGSKHVLIPFHMLNFCYGIVQFLRITTNAPSWIVVDAWLAFPFFTWVIIATLKPDECTMQTFLILDLPFLLCAKWPFLFAPLLALHIGFTVYITLQAVNFSNIGYWLLALLCCCGFIGLKVYDLQLGEWHPFFKVLSGHFWSKLCDVGQAHFISLFLLRLD